MKRLGSILLLAVLGFLLAGCSPVPEGKTLSEWIEVLENWRLPGMRDDMPDNVSPEDTALLEAEASAADEEAARLQEQIELLTSLRASLLGSWSELSDALPLFRPIVSWYGDLNLKEDGSFTSETTSGTWELSEDGSQLTLRGTRGRTVAYRTALI